MANKLNLLAGVIGVIALVHPGRVHAIVAGGETAFPVDSPANRLDLLGSASPFNAVGALAIGSGGFAYRGSATAISPHWVLTAGHNIDFNDNGQPDAGLNISFHLPGYGAYTASGFYTAPGFTGFGNPSIPRTALACPAAVWGMIWKPSSARAIPAGHSCWTTAMAIRSWE